METWKGPKFLVPESGQYCWHLFLPPSSRLMIITMEGALSCHTSLQKSTTVWGRGPDGMVCSVYIHIDISHESGSTAKTHLVYTGMSVVWCSPAWSGGGEGIQHPLTCHFLLCALYMQLLCQYTEQHDCSHHSHNMLAPFIKEVAHIHIAGIDIITLAVFMTIQQPQHHTIVIICVGGAHLATQTTEATYCTYTHRCWQSGSSASCQPWLLWQWTYLYHHRGTMEDTTTSPSQEWAI